jgi:hypothetical protein
MSRGVFRRVQKYKRILFRKKTSSANLKGISGRPSATTHKFGAYSLCPVALSDTGEREEACALMQ